MTEETPISTDNVINLDDAKASLSRLSALDAISYGQQRKTAAKNLGIPVGTLDREVQKRRRTQDDSTKNMVLSSRGEILPILANAIEVLLNARQTWDLKFEQFSQRPFLGPKPLEDRDLLTIAEWVQRAGVHAGRRVTDDAILHVCHRRQWHAVQAWLGALKWDGIERIDRILIDHAGAPDTPLVRAFTGKWMIQSVARIYEPGCQADATLVLEGPQGIGKSSLLRALFGDDWFSDHLPNLDSKDAQIQLLGIWCIEISELAALSGKENAKTKQFLSSRDDRFRLPFDRIAKNHPRSSVFAGTVNPGASGYLKDETGGRRYWPVPVDHVDVGVICENREQYWAEALHRFNDRETWHLPNGDLSDAARDIQGDRYIGDPWHDLVEKFVTGKSFVTLPDIFTYCLDMPSKSDWGQHEQNRVARCLSHLGWGRKQRRVISTLEDTQRRREWGYEPPRVDDAPPTNEQPAHQSPVDENEW